MSDRSQTDDVRSSSPKLPDLLRLHDLQKLSKAELKKFYLTYSDEVSYNRVVLFLISEAASVILQWISGKLGKSACAKGLQRTNGSGTPIIISIIATNKSDKSLNILTIFNSAQKLEILKSCDSDGNNVLYHMMITQTMTKARETLIRIYEDLGSKILDLLFSKNKDGTASIFSPELSPKILESVGMFRDKDLDKTLEYCDMDGTGMSVLFHGLISNPSTCTSFVSCTVEKLGSERFVKALVRPMGNGRSALDAVAQHTYRKEVTALMKLLLKETGEMVLLGLLKNPAALSTMEKVRTIIGEEELSSMLLEIDDSETPYVVSAIDRLGEEVTEILKLLTSFGLTSLLTDNQHSPMPYMLISSGAEVIINYIRRMLGSEECVRILLRNGVDTNAAQISPLVKALQMINEEEIAKLLGLFTKEELTMLLIDERYCDCEQRQLICSWVLRHGASDTIRFLRTHLGAENCMRFLMTSDKHDSPTVLAMFDDSWPSQLQNIITDILTLLSSDGAVKVFSANELSAILNYKDCDGCNMLWYILNSDGDSNITIKHIVEKLGKLSCVNLMLERNKQGISAAAKAFMKGNKAVLEFFKLANLSQLERFCSDDINDPRKMYKMLLCDRASDILKEVYISLGGENCRKLVLAGNKHEQPALVRAMLRRKSGVISILEIFTNTELEDILRSHGEESAEISFLRHVFMSCSGLETGEFLYRRLGAEVIADLLNEDPHSDTIVGFLRVAVRVNDQDCFAELISYFINVWHHDKDLRQNLVYQFEHPPLLLPKEWAAERQIINWLEDQIDNSCYLLTKSPNILVIANTKDRPGARTEAGCLINAFKRLDMKVTPKTDLSKQQTIKAIKETMGDSCNIVVMMSHGKAGKVFDNNGSAIDVEELEQAMFERSPADTPKVLILQCCQAEGDVESATNFIAAYNTYTSADPPSWTESDAGASSAQPRKRRVRYAPTHPNFCVIMSCVSGQVSYRNEFIPELADRFEHLEENQDIELVFKNAHSALRVNQTPIILSTLKYRLCLKDRLDCHAYYNLRKPKVKV